MSLNHCCWRKDAGQRGKSELEITQNTSVANKTLSTVAEFIQIYSKPQTESI